MNKIKAMWTKPYCGVSHLCPGSISESWGTIVEYKSFVTIYLHRFYQTEEYQASTVEEAKVVVEKHVLGCAFDTKNITRIS